MTAATIETAQRPNRRVLAKQRTAERVLLAGQTLFEAVGYEKATIRAIAKEVGMSTGAVFANYEDKAALYVAVYGHGPLTPEQGLLLSNLISVSVAELEDGAAAQEVVQQLKAGLASALSEVSA